MAIGRATSTTASRAAGSPRARVRAGSSRQGGAASRRAVERHRRQLAGTACDRCRRASPRRTPSATISSTASAASATATSNSSRWRAGSRDSTWSAPLLLRRRLADADADPHEVLRAEVRGDAAQPVVAGQPAADLDPHRARRQVELVVDDHDPARDRRCRSGGRARRRPGRSRSCTSSGNASTHALRRRCATRRRGRCRGRPSARDSCAAASSPTTSSPTLWRVRAYSLPGLPSPTTSQSNGVEPRDVRLSGDVRITRGGVAAVGRSLGVVALGLLLGGRRVGGLDLGQLGAHRRAR